MLVRVVANALVNSKHRIGVLGAYVRLHREQRDRDHETYGGHHRPGHNVRVEQPAQAVLGT